MYGAAFIGAVGEHEIPEYLSFLILIFWALLVYTAGSGCQGRESHRNWSNEFIFQTNASHKSPAHGPLLGWEHFYPPSCQSRITQTSALSRLIPPHRRVIIWIISRKKANLFQNIARGRAKIIHRKLITLREYVTQMGIEILSWSNRKSKFSFELKRKLEINSVSPSWPTATRMCIRDMAGWKFDRFPFFYLLH